MTLSSVTVLCNGVVKGQRIIKDTESFLTRAYAAVGYPAPEEMTLSALAEIEAGEVVRVLNPAQSTEMKIEGV